MLVINCFSFSAVRPYLKNYSSGSVLAQRVKWWTRFLKVESSNLVYL
jgi:hypothetical protein